MITQNNCFEWQPFGPVADNYLINSTAWINIAVGSIRSGKTIVALTRFIEYTLRSDNTEFMIIGKTLARLHAVGDDRGRGGSLYDCYHFPIPLVTEITLGTRLSLATMEL